MKAGQPGASGRSAAVVPRAPSSAADSRAPTFYFPMGRNLTSPVFTTGSPSGVDSVA